MAENDIKRVETRLDADERAMVQAAADERRTSKNAALRFLLRNGYDHWRPGQTHADGDPCTPECHHDVTAVARDVTNGSE